MNWKMRGRVFGLALLSVNFVAANAGYSVGPAQAASSDPVITYEQSDSAMNAAQAKARVQLGAFFDNVLDTEGNLTADAGVKVAVPVEGGGVEVIWVSPFGMQDGAFVGLLANRPQSIKDKQVGDPITFSEAQVRDWYIYGDDGKMYGSYTTRVMLADMSASSAARVREMLSPSPVPASWQ